jgi:hypothetical protein
VPTRSTANNSSSQTLRLEFGERLEGSPAANSEDGCAHADAEQDLVAAPAIDIDPVQAERPHVGEVHWRSGIFRHLRLR